MGGKIDVRTVGYLLRWQALRTWRSPGALLGVLGWAVALPLVVRLSPGALHGHGPPLESLLERWIMPAALCGALVSVGNFRGAQGLLRRLDETSLWLGSFLATWALSLAALGALLAGGLAARSLSEPIWLLSLPLMALQVAAWASLFLSFPWKTPMKCAALFALVWLVPGAVGYGLGGVADTHILSALGWPLLWLGASLGLRLFLHRSPHTT